MSQAAKPRSSTGDAHKLLTQTLIGLAIGGFFIWLSAREWPLGRLTGVPSVDAGHLLIGGADPTALAAGGATVTAGWAFELWWLLPYLAALTAVHFLRVLRWKPLLDPIVDLDLATHNRIGAVGFMAMFLMPLRLGELVRPYLVKRARPGTRMSRVLSTVVVERVADGLLVSLLLVVILFGLPAEDDVTRATLRIGGLGALAVFAGATVVLAGARWQHDRTVRLVRGTVGAVSQRLARRITDLIDSFLVGLGTLPSVGAFVWFVFLTLVYWAVNGVGTWFMARAFYLPVDLLGGYAMMATVVVGMMIPNSPGNVGSFWYFLLLPLPLYGVASGSTQAIACGLMVWLLQLVQQTVFGLWFVARGDVTLRRVLEAAREADVDSDADDGEEGP